MRTATSPTEATAARESYRDELNFAEFPLASLSTKLPKGQKTLVHGRHLRQGEKSARDEKAHYHGF